MSWPFLHVQRRTFASSDNWGVMYMITSAGDWERLCYSYELAWKPDASGNSKSNVSRIKLGEYELEPRSDGPKGWRLQLRDTGPRTYIQIHRAHKSMYIKGCILPVHFNDFQEAGLKKGDSAIQTHSVALMRQIKTRYDALKRGKSGRPTVLISALLPAMAPVATA